VPVAGELAVEIVPVEHPAQLVPIDIMHIETDHLFKSLPAARRTLELWRVD
jgi:hypothetical protein